MSKVQNETGAKAFTTENGSVNGHKEAQNAPEIV